MGYIDFTYVQAAGEGLLGQISILQRLREELLQVERKIRDMAYMDETLCLLQKSRKEVEEELTMLSCFVQCLEEVGRICKETEQKITDVYNLEVLVYPKTRFGISQITGLEEYKHLLNFRHDAG